MWVYKGPGQSTQRRCFGWREQIDSCEFSFIYPPLNKNHFINDQGPKMKFLEVDKTQPIGPQSKKLVLYFTFYNKLTITLCNNPQQSNGILLCK